MSYLFKTHVTEGFHVMSYESNSASHNIRDLHVGFLSLQFDIEKHNKMSQNFSFSSYRNTKIQLRDKNISTHTWMKFKILWWSKSKITACLFVCLFFFPYHAVQKGNQGSGQNHGVSTYSTVQTLFKHAPTDMPVIMVKISWNVQKFPGKLYVPILLYRAKFPEIKKLVAKFPEIMKFP